MPTVPKSKPFNYGLLRFMREHRKLTQEDMLFKLRESGFEMALKTLSSWENGETCPDANVLPVLADALGVEPADFYKPNGDQ